MPFNTLQYIFLLLLTALVAREMPPKIKMAFILTCSLLFIAWINTYFLVCILVVALISYGGALALERTHGALRKWVFVGSIAITTGILLFFKYPETLMDQYGYWSSLFTTKSFALDVQILLPIGISYYVFQSVGYLAEVYLGSEKPTSNFLHYLLYLSFMPKLLAGPIERSHSFLPQLKGHTQKTKNGLHDGIIRMARGAFKKLIIADGLATLTNPVYSDVSSFSGGLIILVSMLFVFQIYMDLSGYTDLALGAGRIFGFELTENFDKPFRSSSVAEFWRRWHISLSSWVSDYIYRPLSLYLTVQKGWNSMGIVASLFISFALIGIWHGEKITYLYFGIIQGLAIGLERTMKVFINSIGINPNHRRDSLVGNIWVLAVFTFSCTFFVAESMEHVTSVLYQMTQVTNFQQTFHYLGSNGSQFIIIILFIILNELMFRSSFSQWFNRQQKEMKWSGYLMLAALVIMFATIEQTPFIYQRF